MHQSRLRLLRRADSDHRQRSALRTSRRRRCPARRGSRASCPRSPAGPFRAGGRCGEPGLSSAIHRPRHAHLVSQIVAAAVADACRSYRLRAGPGASLQRFGLPASSCFTPRWNTSQARDGRRRRRDVSDRAPNTASRQGYRGTSTSQHNHSGRPLWLHTVAESDLAATLGMEEARSPAGL